MVNNGRKEAVPHVCVTEVSLAVTQKSVLLFTVTRSVKTPHISYFTRSLRRSQNGDELVTSVLTI